MTPALTIGIPLTKWFVDHPHSRVIARYDSTLQLAGDDAQPWAITTKPNAGAFRIVTNELPTWAVESETVFSDNELHGNGDKLAWNESALWNPRVARRELSDGERVRAANRIAEFLHTREFPEARGFWDSLAAMWEYCRCESEIVEPTRRGRSEAISCYRDGIAPSHQTLLAMTTKLVGRGPGLTPTGDDFVQAMLVTLASGDAQDREAFAFVSSRLEPLLAHTTPLSRGFLCEAMHGWAFEPLKNLLGALPDISVADINALVNIGATSGIAYALGVLFALDHAATVNAHC